MLAREVSSIPSSKKTFLACMLMFCVILMVSSMDIYLPALPTMVKHFGSKDNILQLTVMMNPAVSVIFGLFYGRLSDIYGRRNMTVIAMTLFTIGSLMCCFTQSLSFFFISRIIQAIGAGAIAILTPVIIGDLFKGVRFAKYMAMYGVLFPLTWAIAPLIGAHILEHQGWKSIFTYFFWIVALTSVVIIAFLPETLPSHHKDNQQRSFKRTLGKIKNILINKPFILYSLGHVIPIAIYAVMISNLVFVFVDGFNYKPLVFSYLQAIPIIFNLLGAVLYRLMIEKTGYNSALSIGRGGFLLYILLCAGTFINMIPESPYFILAIICLATFSMPFVISASASRVFEVAPTEDRGLAIAILSLIRNCGISLCVIVTGFFINDTITPIFAITTMLAITVVWVINSVLKGSSVEVNQAA